MSNEFDSLDASEKAALVGALKRCRVLAEQIENELRNTSPERFIDELSLADFCVSLECAANVLRQKCRQSVETPASVVNGWQTRKRQRHR
jgi:hypothetical protein